MDLNRNTTARLIAVAILILFLPLLVSCSGYHAEENRYEIEKALFAAEKAQDAYAVKPELKTADDFYKLVWGYRQVYEKYQSLFPNLGSKDEISKTEMEASFIAGKSLVEAAKLLMQAEQYDTAEMLLVQIYSTKYISPQHRNQALLLAGRIAEQKGQWDDAEKLYSDLLQSYYPPATTKLYPEIDIITLPQAIIDHYKTLGDIVHLQQKLDWAIKYYLGITDSFPQTPVAMSAKRLLAEMYNDKGEYQKSVDLLGTVVDSSGRVLDQAKAMIADLYLTQLNRKQEAVQTYLTLMSSGTDTNTIALCYLKLATMELHGKRYQECRDYLDKLKARFPRMGGLLAEAQEMRAQSFEENKEYERAKQEYMVLVNEFPASQQSIDVLVRMPEFLTGIGDVTGAKDWLKKSPEKLKQITRDNPNSSQGLVAMSYLGTFYIRNKMPDEAIQQFMEVRSQYPRSTQASDALLKIALVYQIDKNDKEKALETYREYLKQYPYSTVRTKIEAEVKKLERS